MSIAPAREALLVSACLQFDYEPTLWRDLCGRTHRLKGHVRSLFSSHDEGVLQAGSSAVQTEYFTVLVVQPREKAIVKGNE